MRLADKIQDWLTEQEWSDEQSRDEESGKSVVLTGYNIEGQTYRMAIETDEKREWLKVYLYAPIRVKENKINDTCQLLNHINTIGTGRICLTGDGYICALSMIDVENTDPSLEMISNMIAGVSAIYEFWFDEISSVALTKTTAQEIFEELERQKAEKEETPDAL